MECTNYNCNTGVLSNILSYYKNITVLVTKTLLLKDIHNKFKNSKVESTYYKAPGKKIKHMVDEHPNYTIRVLIITV